MRTALRDGETESWRAELRRQRVREMDFCLLGSPLDTAQPIYSPMQIYEAKSLMCIISFAFHNHPLWEVGTVIISTLQMRKPRQRRAKSFACSHIAKKKLEPILKTQDLKSSHKLVF